MTFTQLSQESLINFQTLCRLQSFMFYTTVCECVYRYLREVFITEFEHSVYGLRYDTVKKTIKNPQTLYKPSVIVQ